MKTQLHKHFWWIAFIFLFQSTAIAQGLPPGWDYVATPSTHIVSLPLDCEPNINGFPILPGDWIGAFFIDDDGELACGGAVEWDGIVNTGLIAFGDDSFTPVKDGFSSGETINYIVYSWSVEKAYAAEVTCNAGLPSSCQLFTPNGLSGLATFDASGFYVAPAAQPDSLCQGDGSQLNANASGGSGSYTYSWSSDPAGFTSNSANPLVAPNQSIVYTVQVTDLGEVLSSSISILVIPPPQVSAGNNISICENEIASLDGDIINYQSFIWTSNGDGGFSNPAIMDPDYTPGPNDILSGGTTLTLTAQAIEPCFVPISANVQLQITGLPQLDAGIDQTVCEVDAVQLSAAAVNYSSLIWTSPGDGTFNDASLANAVYTPGVADLANGSVDLELEVNPIAPCTGLISDFVGVEFMALPVIDAGANIAICENGSALLSGEAVNSGSILWISNGDGIFDDPTSLNATYTPGTDDILNGGAQLSLVAQPIIPCVDVIIDNLDLSITLLPTSNAGADGTVCENGLHQLNASATNFEEVSWSTSGNGVFGDPNALSTTYTPGSDDILAGQVTLILTALPEFPCGESVGDDLLLTLMDLPEINAGDDGSVCEVQAFQLGATAQDYNTVIWSTSGDGLFADPNSLITTYTPGANDVINGNVELTISASPLFPCVTNIEDPLILSLITLPEVSAGDDATVCEDDTYQLSGQASNYLLIQWVTSGDGTYSNAMVLNPVYTPGPIDVQNGEVELSLTAIPQSPCTELQESSLNLTFTALPQANAGPNAIVPGGDVHQLDGAATNYSSVLWTTSGDGVFSDTGALDPFYTPGGQDISLTEVTLTLSANPMSPCVLVAMDDMILEIDTTVQILQFSPLMALNVFPNPSAGLLKVGIPSQTFGASCSIKVFALSGEMLQEDLFFNNAYTDDLFISLDMSFYPDGIYLLQLSSDNSVWQSKVILDK